MSSYVKETFKEYATVRISKIVLEDFKSVGYGEITLNCGRHFIPAGSEPDLLGLYGQNGSGKTTLIEAISILKHLLSGRRVPDAYAECIAVDADFARLSFEFDFQYPSGRMVRVGYSVCLEAVAVEDPVSMLSSERRSGKRLRVFDEIVRMGGDLDGAEQPYRACINTSTVSVRPFSPASKHSLFFSASAKTKASLFVKRILAEERSQSFVFMNDVLTLDDDSGIFNKKKGERSDYYIALWELKCFGSRYLFVIDTTSPALASADITLPLFTPYGTIPFSSNGSQEMPVTLAQSLQKPIDSINGVLGALIPGFSISLRELGPTILKNGKEGVHVALMSCRDGKEFPIRFESDGIKKIVSDAGLLITVFNEKSATVVIDEFDAGVFEYLLGEILHIMQDYGHGQLIFTSHNLRPLEVLDKKYIWFTTTNPDNRYYHMKNVPDNNLREAYFREIMVGEQDEELYDGSKRFKVVAAFRKAVTNYAV
ncbi:MAG: AAA family ATPase [Coriobacteriales bacterium]|nr:AAA family ATPase [Coriobacteriales bacterium]